MMWRVTGDGDHRLILDQDRLVGSIVKVDGDWSVEILWATGDIKFRSANYEACLAYVSGACAMATRMAELR